MVGSREAADLSADFVVCDFDFLSSFFISFLSFFTSFSLVSFERDMICSGKIICRYANLDNLLDAPEEKADLVLFWPAESVIDNGSNRQIDGASPAQV